jgi:hypothetical protein
MRSSSGLVAHSLLGGLTLLAAGAIVLSLVTAPPVAKSQLQGAAKNTAGASSFVLTDVNKVVSPKPVPSLGGRSSESSVVRIVYQAPDRVLDVVSEPQGRTVTLLVVGNKAYEREGSSGVWSTIPASTGSGTTNGQAAAQKVLMPLDSVGGATTVERSDDLYRFVPGNELNLLANLFGQEAVPQLSSVRFSAGIDGEFLRSEDVDAKAGGFSYQIRFRFSSVDRAPAVEPPPPSQVAHLP